MAQYELIMPKMGESVAEATIINWLKEVGESIDIEESVLEIATDKVDSEVPSPVEGKLVEKKFEENDVVQVGEVIAIIETDGADAPASEAPKTETKTDASNEVKEAAAQAEARVSEAQEVTGSIARESNGRFYSPLVRSIAEKEGIPQSELDSIEGSGSEGRVTKHDILTYIDNRGSAPAPAAAPAPAKSAPAAAPAKGGGQMPKYEGTIPVFPGDEIVEMDRMRKLISEHMVMSKHVSPHVTSFVEADVTNIVNWRNKVKKEFEQREGEKITFTPIFIEALVKAIKDFPNINVSVDGDKLVKHKPINIGMAAALPTGNLIVPVIKNADQLNLVGLTKQVNDLAARARAGKLSPDEIKDGTYTLTNVGSFGNVMGTPIINQPQVAIMAVGAIQKKPSVIETPEGDMIAIRHKMFLSHSYDHRVVDGALGGMFVRRVADYLEQWDPNREL
ncbi:dihydrolipoamide acetyltransferase family protein [Phaeocystidibacter luteus]|uniref:Dihydrolipoamide acetyltransferase component of pyruvate dehydrogenase complex n=1 Tax=Phaeocystidibacter luteus TaxID=911197 RepID=A0A6N6RM96_9FLAO|nr:dihydrolipoamide acetyltransferase family protein [Phaeocystidibacter luteus]KAB2814665.1 2-oxo acid dehydrogenase subunit E2 [Phaeocystidibacter luteus]